MPKTTKTSIAAALVALPCQAWAHHFMDGGLPQTVAQGLLSGLGHPVIGLDHAAFIVAAGFLLALVNGGMWGVLALVGGSLFGAALHLAGVGLPGNETGVALSVVLIGGLVLARRRIALSSLSCGLALAGMLHGYAYAETIFGAETAPLAAYLIGFSLVQLGIATAAFLAHRHLSAAREAWAKPVSTGLGAAVGAIGLAFLLFNIAS
jgi:urease accessory protein